MGKAEVYVFFDFTFNNVKAGRVVIQLFNDVVPITAENFRCLCTGEKGIGFNRKPLYFKGSRIHRVVPQCMVQGGDIIHHNGTGGESIYGECFDHENYHLKHSEGGMVGASNNGLLKSSSQFYITTVPCIQLDEQNVIFGKVVKGLDIVIEMSEISRENDIPQQNIVIADCGQLEPNQVCNIGENDGTADVYPPWPNDWDGSCDTKTIINVATDINASGNIFFYKENILDAERKYKKAIRYIDWYYDKTKDKSSSTILQLRNNALLNLSAVRLKINKPKEALQHCNEILQINPQIGKAYYRRAQAKLGLKEYDDALKDLKIAHKFHPNDKHIKRIFESTKMKKLAYLKREKILYLKLFSH